MKTVTGTVVSWDDDQGWGVLRSADVESDVFAHFADVIVDGFRSLRPGQLVRFDCEHFPAGQDGYVFRAGNVTPID